MTVKQIITALICLPPQALVVSYSGNEEHSLATKVVVREAKECYVYDEENKLYDLLKSKPRTKVVEIF